MFSLGQEISKLTNPTPVFFDPEDDIESETIKFSPENEDEGLGLEKSELRSKTAPLLEDIDPSYAGRKVKRKSLGGVFQKVNNTVQSADVDSDESSELSGASDDDDDDDDEEQSEDDLSNRDVNEFKDLVSKRGNDEKDGVSEDVSSDSGQEENVANNDDSMVQQFSNIDVTSEIEKGQAVQNQREIWNRLLECRIKLQKLLIISNKLPQKTRLQCLKEQGGEQLAESLNKGCDSIKMLLNNVLDLHSEISKSENIGKVKSVNHSDEEISSDTGSEADEQLASKCNKRKARTQCYGDELAKRFKDHTPYRNSVIQKWDEKTRLSSGRMTQKSFAAFENSTLKQIEQILQDKQRLIKRTQLKRSLYRLLGTPEESEHHLEDNSNETPATKQDMLLNNYDPEIFDDDDFYRQILKDVIESKSIGMDPSIVRKQMEIQKIRNKMKRKVDTKASKGRKLRYDVHSKLVNFMAPVQMVKIPDNARESLLKCLFGKSLIAPVV